jgi:tetratricopeptide (TPR) repeat protein
LSDLDRLADIAKYTAETWPDRDEGDNARINLGQIYQGRGQYDQAIGVLSSVRRRSSNWAIAQTRLGATHWAKSRLLERRGDTAAASAAAQTAIAILGATLKARQQAGVSQSDPGLVGNVGDLAIVLTETGKPAEALALLTPVVKAQTVRAGPAYVRLMEAQLTAQITSNQVQQAIATMKTLEQAGAGANLTQLYLKLGRLLQRELDALRQRGKTSAFTQLHQAYKTFLTTLAASKTGQTYESLEWAGESLLDLEAYEEAAGLLQRVLKEFTQDPQFLQQPNARNHLLVTRLKLAAALRGQGELKKADQLVSEMLKDYPKYIEPQFEKGMLLEAEAQAKRGDWAAALSHWEALARKAERLRPRPRLYYEIWYHVAWVLSQQKQTLQARQTLQGVMRLAPSVGDPEMKAKYQGLLARLSQR